MNLLQTSGVRDFELRIALLLVFLIVTADAHADAGRDLGCRQRQNVIPESGTFPCGNGKACKRQEDAAGEHHLEQLGLVNIVGVGLLVVLIRTQPGERQGNFTMGILLLQ